MSAQFLTFTYGLSVISALVLTLTVVSTLLVLLLAPGLTMLTHAYLESLPTTSIDYSEFRTASPASFNPATHSAIPSHSLLASLHWLPISQRVTFKLECLVYRSLHDTSPAYQSSLLHAYTPIRSLRSSSAHLLVEPRLRTTLVSRGFRSAGPRIWNSLPNHIKLAPYLFFFRSKLKNHLFTSTAQ